MKLDVSFFAANAGDHHGVWRKGVAAKDAWLKMAVSRVVGGFFEAGRREQPRVAYLEGKPRWDSRCEAPRMIFQS